MRQPIETAPALELTPQAIDNLVEELRAYHAIYSPLFQRREQREGAEKVPARSVAGDSAEVDRADGPDLGRRQCQGGADAALVH